MNANSLMNNRILCVDDDVAILKLYKTILGGECPLSRDDINNGSSKGSTPHGTEIYSLNGQAYEIWLAQSGEEAIRLVLEEWDKGRQFAAGLFDMKMPGGMGGLETIQKALEIDSDLHCAVVTGHNDHGVSEINRVFRSKDQWILLNKPFENDELLQIAHHLVAMWKLKMANQQFIAHLEQEVERRTLKYKEIAHRLILINQLSKEMKSAVDLSELLNRMLEELKLVVGADIGSLLLLEEADHTIVKAAVGPNKEKVVGLKNDIDQNRISNYVIKTKKPLLVADLWQDGRFLDAADQQRPNYDSNMSVPLLVKDKVIGAINFGAAKEHKVFSKEDLEFVNTIACQIAVAIENARLYTELSTSYDQLSHSYILTIKALTKAIDVKDHYTFGHSERVTKYSLTIAEKLNFSQDELHKLRRACVLHDVGKIGISETILNKPGGLTNEEFAEIKKHPAKGAEIIRDIPFLEDITKVIYHHHERFEGNGYPDGIAGEAIPLGARIMAVADTYDAMTSNRPYRKGLDKVVAFDEIKNCSGSQFDPDVVSAFIEVFQEGRL
ncbi:MAG: HD domain-containing protein [Deltaproteobacteria bacterium]|nr:HD domain-containing protein [Deltaproteobacteria bacterium]